MPDGSRMDFLPVAKAKPSRSDSNTSVITCLRTEGCCVERIPAREQQSENMGTAMQTPSFLKLVKLKWQKELIHMLSINKKVCSAELAVLLMPNT
ncbi:hypothetical protein BTVI_146706 [Pitangus sulphuratus]|nr:hypothetical protein BTVI_146706 [Pitangus sulphuratus]